MNENNDREPGGVSARTITIGVILGVTIGVVIGAATDNLPVWIGGGIGIGVVLAIAIDLLSNKESR